ncbi:MAG: glycogen debranching enzyme family protein [Phycisphaerae bacterium]|nr:glycogen debranching enzyme family protein [Phycisphaerae bacterium]
MSTDPSVAPVPNHTADFAVHLGPQTCTNLAESLRREWLVTNGIGGYAMGTVAGALTRRYHALLIAATRPPAVRTAVLSKLEERLIVRGTKYDLSTNLWADGTCAPRGFRHCARFRLERGLPCWRWELEECTLEKRIAMVLGENAVTVEYRLLPGSAPCELHLEALVTNRSHHTLIPTPGFDADIERLNGAIRVRLPQTAQGGVGDELWLHCPEADARLAGGRSGTWWRDLELSAERDRGYDHRDSMLHAATFVARLAPSQRLTFGASLGLPLPRDPQILFVAEQARRQSFLDSSGMSKSPPAVRELALMSDQCVVRRPLGGGQEGWSVIAGYPWFADWSRDTMLALPGLFLTTRRFPAARRVLETYAKRLSGGMLPNRFPDRPDSVDGSETLEYNAADAPLLFVRAVGLVHEAAPDEHWLRSMWPAVRSIVESYTRGTRHGIRVDEADGLVQAGEMGQQLTWMDAKVNGRVITPRMGKPVEINALWYQTLIVARSMAERFGDDAAPLSARIAQVRESFGRFWNSNTNGCFDVIDGPPTPEAPDGNDPSIRPNQILAAGLEHVALDAERAHRLTHTVAEHLLVPIALRTLSPHDRRYCPRYEGDVIRRDESYHQGTAWPWLLSFFVRAWRRAGGEAKMVSTIRAALAEHLTDGGLGGVSEIVDASAPYEPRGCPVQAWSVGAALEIMRELHPDGEACLSDADAAACVGGRS